MSSRKSSSATTEHDERRDDARLCCQRQCLARVVDAERLDVSSTSDIEALLPSFSSSSCGAQGRTCPGPPRRPPAQQRIRWSLRLLADGPADEVAKRRDRLRAALAGFDAATIVTTHQFCQYVLTGLGIAGDGDPDVELVESLDDLVVEVVDDLYVGAFARRATASPIFDRDTALSLARKVIDDPQATLAPAGEDRASPAAWRVRFGTAGAGRGRPAQAATARILGYDDLLSRLATALEPEDAPARDRMRRPLVDRAGRRIPGHRPGAVADPGPGLRRARHHGAGRRPQAVDLRLPRRRHRHLPGAPRGPPARTRR